MTALSDLILQDNQTVLDRMLEHPFVCKISDGSLPDGAYHKYLVYEGSFVETAISIFAFATANAPDLEAKRTLVEIQRALVCDQLPYFEKSYRELGVVRDIPIPEGVRAFDQGMFDLARQGSFTDIVTAMFAAEWMYWTWCSRAAARDIENPHVCEWIQLHADPAFEAQARWLKNAIDRYGALSDRSRLSAIFAKVTELEIAFHDAPLAPTTGMVHA